MTTESVYVGIYLTGVASALITSVVIMRRIGNIKTGTFMSMMMFCLLSWIALISVCTYYMLETVSEDILFRKVEGLPGDEMLAGRFPWSMPIPDGEAGLCLTYDAGRKTWSAFYSAGGSRPVGTVGTASTPDGALAGLRKE